MVLCMKYSSYLKCSLFHIKSTAKFDIMYFFNIWQHWAQSWSYLSCLRGTKSIKSEFSGFYHLIKYQGTKSLSSYTFLFNQLLGSNPIPVNKKSAYIQYLSEIWTKLHTVCSKDIMSEVLNFNCFINNKI